jgi:hypothetical protein
MTDEKFFALIVACMGFLVGVIAMGLLGKAFGGTAEDVLRLCGVPVGMTIALLLWRRTA